MRATRTTLAIFLVVTAILAALGQSKLLGDPDTYWHIAVGRRILATGTFPTVDEYTYSAGGQPWLANQWLAECSLAILDRWGGFDAILCVAVVAAGGLYTWLAARLLNAGAHWTIAALAIALAFSASAYNLVARPHVVTMVLMPVLYSWLVDIDAGRRSLRLLWLTPVVFLVWANLHGGVLGGVATLGLACVSWTTGYWLGWRSPITRAGEILILLGVCLGAVAVLALNPYGIEMFGAWRRILAMDLPHLVIEHARLDPRRLEGIGVLLVATVYGIVLLAAAKGEQRVTWWLPIIWCILAFSRIRHGPLFAGLALVAVADMIPHTAWATRLANRGYWGPRPADSTGHGRWLLAILAAPCLALVLSAVVHRGNRATESHWARPLARIWPDEQRTALDQLEAPSDAPLRIFNDQLFGGYLIYTYPDRQIFIDGRCELFGEPLLRDYLAAQRDPTILARWLHDYPADAALVRRGSAFDRYFDGRSDWQLVSQASNSCLYVHRDVEMVRQLHSN